MKTEPNIFNYATSELSQDAILAWLIEWADIKYSEVDKDMHDLGQRFVHALLNNYSGPIETIHVAKQRENIDILVEINDNIVLVIEDKIDCCIHGDQLERYKEMVTKEYKETKKLYFAFVKTGNSPKGTIDYVRQHGYVPILREDIINILNTYHGSNTLVNDFRKHLQRGEDITLSFENKKEGEKWNALAWQGFFNTLAKYFDIRYWGYVPNPSGGFWGVWWHFIDVCGIKMYIQLEEQKCCIKIDCHEYEGNFSKIRNECFDILNKRKSFMKTLEMQRPKRFGKGKYMTIGLIEDCRIYKNDQDKTIDMDKTVERLQKIECLLDEIEKEQNQKTNNRN